MQRFSAGEEEAFLHAEACELAVLSKEYVGCAAAGRKPKSVLHTLSVELSVLIGLDDSKRLDGLVAEATRLLDFSRPGKPTDNARVESFNGRLRQECLNANWFLSLDDAKAKISAWRTYYNESRPHSALDWSTPTEFARRSGLQAASTILKEPEVPTSERY